MASAASLTEPTVLAHTKRRLFPDPDEWDSYAVVDTQFATDEWLPGQPISSDVRERLAPFNHVRVGSGYPDLVGVRTLDTDLLAVEGFGDDPPFVVVEAKGYTGNSIVDVERGILQAYDRLHEANAAYVAAPVSAISQSNRILARELNVGVLGVDRDGCVDPLEIPRVVGNRTTTETQAIRFQAGAQGVANRSFGLNHPKNYLGYPIAHYAEGRTEDLVTEYVVGAVADARQGAAFLGLIDETPQDAELTPLGREVVRFALNRYGSARTALDEFVDWKRSRQCFSEIAPEWGLLTRRVVWAYPATQLLVEELQQMYANDIPWPSLVDLVERLHEKYPSFSVELFIRGTDDVRGRVLDGDGKLRPAELIDGNVYHAPTVFQLKAMFYHAGILTERGSEPHQLDPTTDVWALNQPLDPR